MAQSHGTLGITATYLGDFERAEDHLEKCMALSMQVHDQNELANAVNHMGFLLLCVGRFAESRVAYRQHLGRLAEMSLFLAEPVAMIAFSLTLEGRYEEALEGIESASGRPRLQIADKGDLAWSRGIALLGLGRRQEAVACLHRSAQILEKLRQLTVYSGVMSFLLMAKGGRGDVVATIRLARQARSFLAYMIALPSVALYFLEAGDTLQAVELYAAAGKHPYVSNSKWYADLVGRPIDAAAAALHVEAVAAAKARGVQRELGPIITELAAKLDEP
jgi:tetratricopeptide (TPR) repeat protein